MLDQRVYIYSNLIIITKHFPRLLVLNCTSTSRINSRRNKFKEKKKTKKIIFWDFAIGWKEKEISPENLYSQTSSSGFVASEIKLSS